MTITEFLLARISETEQKAYQIYIDELGDWWKLEDEVLADCAAKRAIAHQQEAWDQDETLLWVVKNLAAPYSGHPDYQQEWKP